MAQTNHLINTLKKALKAHGMTYADDKIIHRTCISAGIKRQKYQATTGSLER